MRQTWAAFVSLLLLAGCSREPGSTVITKGARTIECDEAVFPVMQLEVADFEQQYTEAKITLRSVDGRVAVADFGSDSAQVIVCARAFNKEEKEAFAAAKIDYQEYKVALTAVAVIVNQENPVTEMRTGELDSIFTGLISRWPGTNRPIDAVIGGINSSTNEVFGNVVLHGKEFDRAATSIDSSGKLVAYVGSHRNAIGIVGLNWVKSGGAAVSVLGVGTPGTRPDSTEPFGAFYPPLQAYVYQKYYALTTPIYIYSRSKTQDVSLGFISYVSSPPGQRIFLNNDLVPATQPVRLVSLTSEQVN
jgi:phosphate transport system substrate-binding protein